MKKLLILIVALSMVTIGAFGVIAANNGPAEIKLPASMGEVTLDHAAHQGRAADCTTCHHNGVEAGKCTSCHDGTKAPEAKKAFHTLCKDCHKKQNGPTKCKECHTGPKG